MKQNMSPYVLKVRFGLSEIRLLFLVLLGFCVIALVTKIVYITSEEVPTIKQPTPKPGWNQDFERDIDNKWIVAVSKIKRKLTRPVREKGYTIVYVTENFNENDFQMCRAPHCIYIDPREQRSMAFKIVKHLPSGTSSRRLIGFLHAMSRSAKVIYYKNVYKNSDSSSSFPYLYSYTVMEYTLDPESVSDLRKANFNQTSTLSVPWLIYHKYLLKREGGDIPTKPPKHKGEKKENYEHKNSKSGNGFTVIDSSLSSFQYKSFWALIFPTLLGGIGHSITRRLMKEAHIGISLTDFPETNLAEVQRNSEGGISRKKEAKKRKRLDAILKHWECNPSFKFFSCILDIGHMLLREEIISNKYFEIIKSWIMDLILIDIYEPVRRFDVRNKMETPLSLNQASSRPGHQTLSAKCPGMMLSNNIAVIDDIALVIVFNEASLYSNIPLLESIYRGYFKHIIYCGPYLDSFTEHSAEQDEIFHFVFIEALQQGWYFFYECLMVASQLNIDVKGYIQIGDDTLLNPWNLKTLPRNKMWLHTGIDALNTSMVDINPHWVWWQSRWGKSAVLNSLDFIISEASEGVDSTFTNFKKTYLANSEGLTFIYRQSCDFMYIPKVHVDNYLKIGSIFLKNEAMVEVVHGTIIMGLAPYKDIIFIKDGNLYTSEEKITVWMSYNRKDVFLHPFKLSYMKEHPLLRSVFCEKYMVDSEMYL